MALGSEVNSRRINTQWCLCLTPLPQVVSVENVIFKFFLKAPIELYRASWLPTHSLYADCTVFVLELILEFILGLSSPNSLSCSQESYVCVSPTVGLQHFLSIVSPQNFVNVSLAFRYGSLTLSY